MAPTEAPGTIDNPHPVPPQGEGGQIEEVKDPPAPTTTSQAPQEPGQGDWRHPPCHASCKQARSVYLSCNNLQVPLG